jgi:hypothetical protein
MHVLNGECHKQFWAQHEPHAHGGTVFNAVTLNHPAERPLVDPISCHVPTAGDEGQVRLITDQ